MNETQLNHLNEDQFTALLAGELATDAQATAAQAHLDACAECRHEMERVSESMESFSALSMEWAERKAATLPPVRPVEQASWMRPLAWAGATALVALGLYAGVQHSTALQQNVAENTVPAMVGPASISAPAPQPTAKTLTRDEQIAADNQLLFAIREELSHPNPVPPASMRHGRAIRPVND